MLPLYVLIVLAGVGYYVTKEAPRPRMNRLRVNHGDNPSVNNVYDSTYCDQTNATLHKKNEVMFKKSLDPQNTGVISKNFALNNETAGFVESRLAGIEIPKSEFTHNNMVPYFGGTVRPIRDGETHSVLENHTGVFEFQRSKKEVEHFGDQSEHMGNVFGSTGAYQSESDRMVASKFRTSELPFEKVYVGPGIARGFESQPTGGFQQFDQREYERDRTVDELRVLTKPKVSFEARNVDGMKSGLRGKIGDVCKNRVETFYENGEDRYFTTTGAQLKDAQRPEEIVKYTQRLDTTRQYEGNAHLPRGEKLNPAIKESSRQRLKEFGIANPTLQEYGKGSGYDHGKNSILVYTNERDTTACRTYEGNVVSAIKAVVAPLQDLARTSIKEYSVQNPRPYGQLNRQLPEKATIYDPNDVARTTIKETLIHDPQSGNVRGPQRVTVYDPEDITRVTSRQTLNEPETNVNFHGHEKGYVHDPDDLAKTTTRQTTIDLERDGNIDSLSKDGGYKTTTMDVKTTQRQFTADNEYEGNVYVRDANGYNVAVYDPKTTQKQFTADNDYYGGGRSSHDKQMSYVDIYNATPNTTKESVMMGRDPTRTGVKVAAGGDKVHMDARKNQIESLPQQPIHNRNHVVNAIPTKNLVEVTREKPRYVEDDRLDINLLTAFHENPYTHSLNSVV